MNTKTYRAAAICLVLLLLAIGLVIYQSKSASPAGETAHNPPAATAEIKVIERTIEEKKDSVSIDVAYPFFENAPYSVNETIRAYVDLRIKELKDAAEEDAKARRATLPAGEPFTPIPYYTDISYELKQANQSFISVVLLEDVYNGGAHGNRVFRSFNFDAKTGREVRLADLFPGRGDYLPEIAALVKQEIIKQVRERDEVNDTDRTGTIEESLFLEGLEPKKENFAIFTFDDKTVSFYFPPYQVAAYALGDFKVVMPRSLISNGPQ